MRLRRAAALGLLHGPAELLPVSSSAHAALLLADVEPERRKEIEVALHAGTLLALGPPAPARWLLPATAIPAVAGLVLERPIERRLGRRAIAVGLLAGGVAMAVADRGRGRRGSPPRLADGVWLGLGQAAALAPGVSRHGAALTVLRARGFERDAAHAISREAAKPVLAGAAALKGARIARRREADPSLLVAAAASAVSTRMAMRALAGRGTAAPLWPYSLYRAGLAAVVAAQPSRT